MGILDFLKKPDFHGLLEESRQTPQAVLVDVRTPEEYSLGHVHGALNIPVDQIGQVDLAKDRPLYLYCHSGARSSMAVSSLKRMGYPHVTNLGGILSYHGPLEQQ